MSRGLKKVIKSVLTNELEDYVEEMVVEKLENLDPFIIDTLKSKGIVLEIISVEHDPDDEPWGTVYKFIRNKSSVLVDVSGYYGDFECNFVVPQQRTVKFIQYNKTESVFS
jgi:hypothetical protein